MNREDIIQFAQEAKLLPIRTGDLDYFAALVAAHEREACAKVAEVAGEPDGADIAYNIRARGRA